MCTTRQQREILAKYIKMYFKVIILKIQHWIKIGHRSRKQTRKARNKLRIQKFSCNKIYLHWRGNTELFNKVLKQLAICEKAKLEPNYCTVSSC